MAFYNLKQFDRVLPWFRLCALVSLVISLSLADNAVPIVITTTILFGAGLLLNHKPTTYVFLSVIVPFGLFTLAVASIAIPPNELTNLGSKNLRPDITWSAYGLRFGRITGVCLSVSLFLGSLSPSGLYRWLVGLNVSKPVAFQIISPLIICHSLSRQLKTIFDSRLVQGYVKTRGFISMGRQLIPVLKILISSGLNSAAERGEIWRQDDIFSLLEKDKTHVQLPASNGLQISIIILFSSIILSLANLFWSHFE